MATKLSLQKITESDAGETAIITKPNSNASTIEGLPIPLKMTYHRVEEQNVWCSCYKTICNPPSSSSDCMAILEGKFHLCDASGDPANCNLADGAYGKDGLYDGYIYLPSELRVFSSVFSVTATVDVGLGTAYGASVQTIPIGNEDPFDGEKKIHVSVYMPYQTGGNIQVNVNARIIGTAK